MTGYQAAAPLQESPLARIVTVATPAPIAAMGAESFERQESIFIAMNLCAMGALVATHLVFAPSMGAPPLAVFVLFGARMAMQSAELAWLQLRRPALGESAVRTYAHASIWLNMAFAFLVSVIASSEDAHYTVLMILPLIAAGFRFSWPRVMLAVLAAAALNFLELWIFFAKHPPVEVNEYFEALTLVILLAIVSAMVWMFAYHLRREESSLKSANEALRDARDRLIAEEKLAAVGRLASSIAHEIRNPVAMIASSLALANKETASQELRAELCGIASKESARLEGLTNDFLAYARTPKPDLKPTDLYALVAYVADLTRSRAAERGLSIALACQAPPPVAIDSFLIQQGLVNLVLNAIDATPSGETVTIGIEALPGNRVSLYVENPGPPVAEEMESSIFEPFCTNKPGGTGLGLAIAQNNARAHGGDLALVANAPGHVRFAFTLPTRASSALGSV